MVVPIRHGPPELDNAQSSRPEETYADCKSRRRRMGERNARTNGAATMWQGESTNTKCPRLLWVIGWLGHLLLATSSKTRKSTKRRDSVIY